jgi:hypothetical protein
MSDLEGLNGVLSQKCKFSIFSPTCIGKPGEKVVAGELLPKNVVTGFGIFALVKTSFFQ